MLLYFSAAAGCSLLTKTGAGNEDEDTTRITALYDFRFQTQKSRGFANNLVCMSIYMFFSKIYYIFAYEMKCTSEHAPLAVAEADDDDAI